MAENTEISWSDATFNPWLGCTAVSAACKNCYAQTLVEGRFGKAKWGKGQPRVRTSEDNWKKPLIWNRKAEASSTRMRVFCASLADVFDEEVPEEWRADLFELIDATPNLDWLLLTKRPENIERLWPFGWYDDQFTWPNVWIGTTVEDQKTADERIPHLLRVPANVRFLSMEPLLGAVDLRMIPNEFNFGEGQDYLNVLSGLAWSNPAGYHHDVCAIGAGIDWVITGGESGANARPSHPDWFRKLRDDCAAAGVAFHFKQWGEWFPRELWEDNPDLILPNDCDYERDKNTVTLEEHMVMHKVGKKAAGRVLDGVTHDGFPDVAEVAR